uniref:Uncharacterized protein n=1 Tax=Brassica oleracea var. oleracea TaxID=109376 RepID=A0A0D3DSL7_BRAOL
MGVYILHLGVKPSKKKFDYVLHTSESEPWHLNHLMALLFHPLKFIALTHCLENSWFFFYLMQLFHGEARHLFTDMPKGKLKNLFYAYGLFKAYEGLEFSRTGSTAVKNGF